MPRKDPEEHREYQRDLYRRNRERVRAGQREYRRRNREALLARRREVYATRQTLVDELLGVECVWCGVSGDLVSHHLDPAGKEFGLLSPSGVYPSVEQFKVEAAKCIRLCRSCHTTYHLYERYHQ